MNDLPMIAPGAFTLAEILSQPAAWSEALVRLDSIRNDLFSFLRPKRFDYLAFTGCGSTYYLALAAAANAQKLYPISSRGFPASELWLNPETNYPGKGKGLLVAISRSGATTETIKACQAFKQDNRGELVTITCVGEETLATLGDYNIVLPSGAERSVAQTRAFTTLYIGSIYLLCILADRQDLFTDLHLLPEAGQKLFEKYRELAFSLGRNLRLDRFYFLGSGPRYGLASELSLKMKEMSLSHSEPFHFMEFRHGPMSMVNDETLLIGLVSKTNREREMRVLEEMRSMGAKILSMGYEGTDIIFENEISENVSSVLYLPLGQLLAFERSIQKSLNPDRPHNLSDVIRLLETD